MSQRSLFLSDNIFADCVVNTAGPTNYRFIIRYIPLLTNTHLKTTGNMILKFD